MFMFCSMACPLQWQSIVLPMKVIYGSQEVRRTPCPHGSPLSLLRFKNVKHSRGAAASAGWLFKQLQTPGKGHPYNSSATIWPEIFGTGCPQSISIKMDPANPNQMRHALEQLLFSAWQVCSLPMEDYGQTITRTTPTPRCPHCRPDPSWRNRFHWHFTSIQSSSFLQTFNAWCDHSLVNTCLVLCCLPWVQTVQDTLGFSKHGTCQEKGSASY